EPAAVALGAPPPRREQQPRLAAAVRAPDHPDRAPEDPQQRMGGGRVVTEQAGQVLGVTDLDVLAGQADLAVRVALAARRVVEDVVAARGEPDVVPVDGLVGVRAAVRPGPLPGLAE